MKKKNGFIAISIIYAFFLVFIAMLLSIAAEYVQNRILLKDIKEQTQEELEEKISIDNSDIELAYTVIGDATKPETFPHKDSGWYVDSVTCEKGVTANWDNNNWNLINIKPNNQKKIKCNVTFTTTQKSGVDFIKELMPSDDLIVDDTIDENIRYIGANPNNYVLFNGEYWRIIGVMNNVDTGNVHDVGVSGLDPKIKIIRNQSIGIYSWDNKNKNDWDASPLRMVLLEGLFYQKETLDCPYGQNGNTKCFFGTTGLGDEARKMIQIAEWKKRGLSDNKNTAKEFYVSERSGSLPVGVVGAVAYNSVGLIYPSDFGYAVGRTVRATCLDKNLSDWTNECLINNWLYHENTYWTITPVSSESNQVFNVGEVLGMGIDFSNAIDNEVYPVVYLKEDVKIIGGSGTQENPYILSL